MATHSTRTYRTDTTDSTEKSPTLEPRVAKLEVGLDRLTEDVRDLAGVVRSQGSRMEGEIQKLVVAVTQASGPRKTDWPTIISAIMLMMAIGSAVFWPLNQTAQNNKTDLEHLTRDFERHQQLDNHPVGAAIVDRIEREAKTRSDSHAHEMELLDSRLQDEFKSADAEINRRLAIVEACRTDQTKAELEELRMWRLKAMGITNGK